MDNNLVGQTIKGRYYVVRQLGRGGVGVTFLAKDQQCFDSQCVVKQLKPTTITPETLAIARRLFNREAEIMNRLGHCDRIPRLLAYFEYENDFFLVQELIEGHDLSKEIIVGKPWTETRAIALVEDVLEVLLIVQQHSVIHRDLKPSNLMRRSQDNKIILIDFGSVKQVSTQIIDAAGQIKQTVAVGTKSYMPVEQMMGHPGFSSDIYALGIIAIQALTGIHPRNLRIDGRGEIIWRSRLDNQVNYQPRLLDILDKMTRYRHQERYKSPRTVLEDLRQLDATQNNTKETLIISKSKSNKNTPAATNFPDNSQSGLTLKTNQSPVAASNSLNPTTITQGTSSPIQPNQVPLSSKSQPSRSALLPLVIGLFTLLAVGWGGWMIWQQQSPESEIELQVYENSRQGFKINYPDDWSQQNRDDFFATGVVFFSALEDSSDRFKERVSILVEDLAADTSLTQYTATSLAEIKRLSDPNIGAAQTINLGQQLGKQIVYQGEENGGAVQRLQAWSVKDNQAYVITYTARPESYETFLPTVEKMMESFEVVN